MALLVTKKWSGRSNSGDEAEDVYEVSGVNNLAEARVAPGIPQLNNGYSEDPKLKAMKPQATVRGFGLYEVRVRFAIPPQGGFTDETDVDPINRRAKYEWLIGSTSEPIELAADGDDPFKVPMLNAAGDPLDPPTQEDFPSQRIRARKFLPDFDLPTALDFMFTTNTDAFQILGRWNVAVGQARVESVKPLGEYDSTSTVFDCELIMEFRRDGFQFRSLNAGYNGWWDDNGTKKPGAFYNTNERVRLDETGKPLNTNQLVVNASGSPVAAVSAPTSYAPSVLTASANATFVLYQRRKRAFAPLLQLFS